MGADADADADADAAEDEADAVDAPAAAGLDSSPTRPHQTVMQDSQRKWAADRRAHRPLTCMEGTGVAATPLTCTKSGTTGTPVTAAVLTFLDGTQALRAQWNAAGPIIRRRTRATSTRNMWPQDGDPARPKSTKNICQFLEQNMANDWQARGVELIIIMFYVKNMTPRNPLKIVNKIGQMMKQL